MTLKPELTAVLIVPVLSAGLFIVHVNLGAFLAFFCLHSGHAHNENFDKYFLVFFFPSPRLWKRDTRITAEFAHSYQCNFVD